MKGDCTGGDNGKLISADEDHPQMKGDCTDLGMFSLAALDEDHPQMKGDCTDYKSHVVDPTR